MMYNNINYEILVLSSSHDVIENMVRFVDFILYSMNVLVNSSVSFAPGNEILDSFELPIEWAFQKTYKFNF